jgi:hypothetical protein
VILGAAAVPAAGCRERQVGAPSPVVNPAVPDAEASFENIFAAFRRIVEDTRVGFVMRDKGGHSMMVGKNKVSYELIRPKNPSDSYRAIITVDSESHYSMQRDPEDKESPELEEKSSLPETDEEGVEVFDSDLVSSPAPSQTRASRNEKAEGTVARRPDVDSRKFELIYENKRWKLTTKPDPKTELMIQDAFDRVLRDQA